MMRRTAAPQSLAVMLTGLLMLGGAALPQGALGQDIASPARADARDAATRAKLQQLVAADYDELPLRDLLNQLQEELGVEIYFNVRTLIDDMQITDPIAPVTIRLKQVRAGMLLDLALAQVGGGSIDYVIRDGIVVITNIEALEVPMVMRIYPVADLLAAKSASPSLAPPSAFGPPEELSGPVAMFGVSGPSEAMQSLVDTLIGAVAPETWTERSGRGVMIPYGERLLVRQTPLVHRELQETLDMMREGDADK
jgi:hypothetical protein